MLCGWHCLATLPDISITASREEHLPWQHDMLHCKRPWRIAPCLFPGHQKKSKSISPQSNSSLRQYCPAADSASPRALRNGSKNNHNQSLRNGLTVICAQVDPKPASLFSTVAYCMRSRGIAWKLRTWLLCIAQRTLPGALHRICCWPTHDSSITCVSL